MKIPTTRVHPSLRILNIKSDPRATILMYKAKRLHNHLVMPHYIPVADGSVNAELNSQIVPKQCYKKEGVKKKRIAFYAAF
jgi:hypothetical protein